MAAAMITQKVSVSPGVIRNQYGVCLHLKGTKSKEFSLSDDSRLSIDFHGNYWAALPPGASSLAGWILPLKIQYPKITTPANSTNCSLSFTLGAKGMSHTLLLSTLDELITLGDPPILVEIFYTKIHTKNTILLTQGTFLPSTFAKAFRAKSEQNILTKEVPIESIPRRTNTLRNTLRAFRWLLFPILFLLLCWSSLYYPSGNHPASPYTFGILQKLANSSFTTDFQSIAPPHPSTIGQAWELGKLYSKLEQDSTQKYKILYEATQILGLDKISLAHFEEIPNVIKEVEESRGFVVRYLGFFSFVNIIWLLAIIGISVSVGPTICVLTKPLRKWMRRVWRSVYKFLSSVLRFFHEWGVFDSMAWILVFSIFVEGLEIPSQDIRFYVTLTGFGLSFPCAFYSTILFGLHIMKKLNPRNTCHLINGLIVIGSIPLAIHFNSELFGFMAVVCFYSILGFSVVCRNFCYFIGFENDTAMRVAIASGLLLFGSSLFTFLCGPSQSPFQVPIAIYGSLTFYLALLFYSTLHYNACPSRWHRYTARQLPIVLALCLGLFFGHVVMISSGLATTSLVFLVLFIIEKTCDLHVHMLWSGWVLVFFLSCCSYYAALLLHANPEIVSSMLQFQEAESIVH